MSKSSRFRKQDSDRSGFTYLHRELIKDDGNLVGPDEFDAPPPSDLPTGGEGDVTQGENFRSVADPDNPSTDTPSENQIPIQYVTAGGGITAQNQVYRRSGELKNGGLLQISGSNSAVDISANPQISAGQNEQKLTLHCIDSSVTLEDGNGLNLRTHFVMDSGSIISLIYDTGNNVWQETTRMHTTGRNLSL